MQQPAQQQTQQQRVDQDGPGMMGEGGMLGCGMMGRGMMGHGGMMGPVIMRIIFSLMDSDGDGTISLREFQAAHERIFEAMNANKDGRVTVEEMQAFIWGQEIGSAAVGPDESIRDVRNCGGDPPDWQNGAEEKAKSSQTDHHQAA